MKLRWSFERIQSHRNRQASQPSYCELGLDRPTYILAISMLALRSFWKFWNVPWWTCHFPCRCFQDIPCAMALGSLSWAGGMMMQLSCKMCAFFKPESLQWLHQGYRNMLDQIGMLLKFQDSFLRDCFFIQGYTTILGLFLMPCIDIILRGNEPYEFIWPPHDWNMHLPC